MRNHNISRNVDWKQKLQQIGTSRLLPLSEVCVLDFPSSLFLSQQFAADQARVETLHVLALALKLVPNKIDSTANLKPFRYIISI